MAPMIPLGVHPIMRLPPAGLEQNAKQSELPLFWPLPRTQPMVAPEAGAQPLVLKGTTLTPMGRAILTNSAGEPVGLGPRMYVDFSGRMATHPDDRLPPAADPNDMQLNPINGAPNLGIGLQPLWPLWFTRPDIPGNYATTQSNAYEAQVRPGVFYDTGAFSNGGTTTFSVPTIALDGTAAAHHRGEVHFFSPTAASTGNAVVASRFQYDSQTASLLSFGPGQAYVDAFVVNNDHVVARSLFARTLSANEQHDFLVGVAETIFGNLSIMPLQLSTGGLPVGRHPGRSIPTRARFLTEQPNFATPAFGATANTRPRLISSNKPATISMPERTPSSVAFQHLAVDSDTQDLTASTLFK